MEENFCNFDLTNIYTPVSHEQLDILLRETNYPEVKRDFLVNGFKFGFDLGYRGSHKEKLTSPNLRFVVGNEEVLWEKMMNETRNKRFAGPFPDQPPFEFYIQSPVGLVPKDGGNKTRLIFHHTLEMAQHQSITIHQNTCAL